MSYMSDFWYRTSLLAMVFIIGACIVADWVYSSSDRCSI